MGTGHNHRGMRILVTGAAGFIGSHLCDRFLADGHGVWGLDNFDDFYAPAIKRRNLEEALAHPCMHLVEGDVRDGVLLDGLLSSIPFDLVVHLAARPGIRPSLAGPELCWEVNVTGTLRLLEAMRRHHLSRLVFASSAAVYGPRDGRDGAFFESGPAGAPESPYAASKRSGELLCHTWHRLWGLSVHCLRFFTVYGPRQRPDLVISKFAGLLRDGGRIPVYGDGSSTRDYTFVADVVEAIARSAQRLRGRAASKPECEILNIGNGRAVELLDMLRTLSDALGVEPRVRHVDPPPGEPPALRADGRRVVEVLDFAPDTPLRAGLDEFVAWFETLSAEERISVPAGV
ncbi:MAG: NAD-dependent epimerase/dehydratase family protein [Gemmatimonadota bacterium]